VCQVGDFRRYRRFRQSGCSQTLLLLTTMLLLLALLPTAMGVMTART
jgi:hypothetical protein